MPASVQVPKTYDIINWLVSGSQEIPKNFLANSECAKAVEKSLVYIPEQLWHIPQAAWYVNKHLNDIENIPRITGKGFEQLRDTLNVFKKIFTFQKISKRQLYQSRFEFRPKLIEAIEQYEGYDEGNAKAKALMMINLNVPTNRYFKSKATKAEVKKNSSTEVKKSIQEAIALKEQKDVQKHLASIPKSNESIFINEDDMCQQLIDEEELILFDVSLLKKRNQILFIFIDKNNHKKYLVKPFAAKIYISNQDCVINNDYIEELNPEKFAGYIITEIKLYTKLKYILNHSYKKILNGGT